MDCEMRNETEPWWLQFNLDIIGFEDQEDEDEEEEESDEESEESEDEESDEEEDEESEEEEEGDKKKNIAGLKSALRKERMARKKAERELKKLTKASSNNDKGEEGKKKEDEKGKEEDKSSEELEAERRKSERLAERLRTNAVDTLILRFANDFKDAEDVLRLIDRSEIDVDQDEDDPSEIEVDEDSVKDAVKVLRKKKPHLLKSEEERTRSGSKFGGRRDKKGEPSEDELRRKYPSLRR